MNIAISGRGGSSGTPNPKKVSSWELKYEQDLEFIATGRQLRFQQKKRERKKQVKRLRREKVLLRLASRRNMSEKLSIFLTNNNGDTTTPPTSSDPRQLTLEAEIDKKIQEIESELGALEREHRR